MPQIAPQHQSLSIPASQVKAGRLLEVELGNQRIVVTRVAGQVCAFNALCPHQLGNLARGFLHNGEIECPVHGWRFDVSSGQSVYPEEESLRLRCVAASEADGIITIGLAQPVP